MFAGAAVVNVTFSEPVPPAVKAEPYSLVSLPSMSSANAAIRYNHFHDSAGSGGRMGPNWTPA